MSKYISEYILKSEYRCRCCKSLPPIVENGDHLSTAPYRELFETFKKIREKWGKPIKITSGYRCRHHNEAIGGTQLSTHLFGLALDLDCKDGIEVTELFNVIEKINTELRVGIYQNGKSFIHIDTGYWIFPRPLAEYHKGAKWYG